MPRQPGRVWATITRGVAAQYQRGTPSRQAQLFNLLLTNRARGPPLLHCTKLEQARSLIRVGQIAGVSSSKAAATRSGVGSSTPSS